MNFEEFMPFVNEFEAECEAYENGDIQDDEWSEECKQDWIEKCNS